MFSVCNQSLVVLIETTKSNMNTIQIQLSKSINLLEARIVFQLSFLFTINIMFSDSNQSLVVSIETKKKIM